MWLAHGLTLARLPIAMGFVWAYGHAGMAIALIALAALTDTLDGTVARWQKRRGATGPDIGGWLDPLIDKLFVVIVLAVIYMHQRDWRVLALVGARELLFVPLVGLYLARRTPTRELHADPLGKAATVAQFLALGIIVAAPRWSIHAALGAAALGTAAALHYIVRAIRRLATPSAR